MAVIATAGNRLSGSVGVGFEELEETSMAITPDGGRLYVANGRHSGKVSVIDTTRDTVVATLPVAGTLSIAPDGGKVYVVGDKLSVIDTRSNKVVSTIPIKGFGKVEFAGSPAR